MMILSFSLLLMIGRRAEVHNDPNRRQFQVEYEVPLTGRLSRLLAQSTKPSLPSFDFSPSLSLLSLFCKPDYHRVVYVRSINLTRFRLNLNNGPNQAQTIARKASP